MGCCNLLLLSKYIAVVLIVVVVVVAVVIIFVVWDCFVSGGLFLQTLGRKGFICSTLKEREFFLCCWKYLFA